MAVGDKKPVVMEADRAVPGGIATLGTDGKLSSEQIPDLEALGAIEYINSLPFTRKNLLDNWYFGNPVDQRGGYVVPPGIPYWTAMVDGTNPGSTDKYYKATVNTTRSDLFEFVMEGVTFYVPNYHVVRGYVGPCYGIDRWWIGANMVLLIEGDEIVLKNTGTSFGVMYQFTCENNMLGGQCCTGSALINDQLLSFSGEVAKNPSTDTYVGASEQIDAGYIEYWSRADKKEVWHFIVNAGKEMRIKAAKLEPGSTQTLAHQDENGNWVLNEIPNYAEELAKCQRYQYNFAAPPSGQRNLCTFVAHSTSHGFVNIPLPTTMREMAQAVATKLNATGFFSDGFNNKEVALSNWGKAENGMVYFAVEANGTFVAGNCYSLYIPSGASLLLDANL